MSKEDQNKPFAEFEEDMTLLGHEEPQRLFTGRAGAELARWTDSYLIRTLSSPANLTVS